MKAIITSHVPKAISALCLALLMPLFPTKAMAEEQQGDSALVVATRLRHLPCVVPMPYNEAVAQSIGAYCTSERQLVANTLGQGSFFFPLFEDALEASQLPLELKYMPVVLSSLNPMATNASGDAGLWMLPIGRAKELGLEVTSLVDERRDPLRSTYAAAQHLSQLHESLGDWTLTLAAYACGLDNVNKALKRSGDQRDYWRIRPLLPKEGQDFVPAFIAMAYVMNWYCDYGITPSPCELPAKTDTLMLTRDVSLEQVAAVCNVSMEELRSLNPQYRTSLVPASSRPCPLRLRTDTEMAFLSAGDSVYEYRQDELLASKQTVTEVTLSTPAPTPTRQKGKGRGASYVTVRRGDTLGAIASRNSTTVARLRSLNGLRGNTIRVGQKLRVR